eukprot:TRINITY_DN2699_c0_g1_i3.p1 TRINITY_DN2699_c0_g1~~TRINITY_DN2699_c0_g1_i3.p1  ORF type:complete len:302 (+),score=57.44 TRINITY_DN2699_c0_g1_i3:300-1205(+)
MLTHTVKKQPEPGKWKLEKQATLLVDEQRVAPGAGTAQADSDEDYGGKKKVKGRSKKGARPAGPIMTQEAFKQMVLKPGAKMATIVDKMGWWNVDAAYSAPTTAVMMSGRILDSHGQNVVNTQLWSVGMDYKGRAADITDSEGKFSSLLAQFKSQVKIEVHTKHKIETDAEIRVSYSREEWRQVDGSKHYLMLGETRSAQYQKGRDSTARIEWNPDRRRWQHVLNDGKVVFVKQEAKPTSPLGMGWATLSLLAGDKYAVPAPEYDYNVKVKKVTLGPFLTNDAGEVRDLGTLKLGSGCSGR